MHCAQVQNRSNKHSVHTILLNKTSHQFHLSPDNMQKNKQNDYTKMSQILNATQYVCPVPPCDIVKQADSFHSVRLHCSTGWLTCGTQTHLFADYKSSLPTIWSWQDKRKPRTTMKWTTGWLTRALFRNMLYYAFPYI